MLRIGAVLGTGLTVPGLVLVDVGDEYVRIEVLPAYDIADTVIVLAGELMKEVKF